MRPWLPACGDRKCCTARTSGSILSSPRGRCATGPTVRLGVIGFGTPCTVAPLHGFWLFDDDRVVIESYSAELTLAQPQEIELYARTFDALAADASYGRAARAIITSVVDDLAASTPSDGD